MWTQTILPSKGGGGGNARVDRHEIMFHVKPRKTTNRKPDKLFLEVNIGRDQVRGRLKPGDRVALLLNLTDRIIGIRRVPAKDKMGFVLSGTNNLKFSIADHNFDTESWELIYGMFSARPICLGEIRYNGDEELICSLAPADAVAA